MNVRGGYSRRSGAIERLVPIAGWVGQRSAAETETSDPTAAASDLMRCGMMIAVRLAQVRPEGTGISFQPSPFFANMCKGAGTRST